MLKYCSCRTLNKKEELITGQSEKVGYKRAGKDQEWVESRGKKKDKGQGSSRSGVWSKALKALCFNRIVRQETSSLAGLCCSEHNDWVVWYFICSMGN